MASAKKKVARRSRPARTRTKTNAVVRTKVRSRTGCLVIIGGREDKEQDLAILTEVAKRTGQGRLVVVTAASELPDELWGDYQTAFRSLGVKNLAHLKISSHQEARSRANLDVFADATTVFFTGGDQLRVTSKLGGTPVFERIFEIFQSGGTIAGTSAGASIMGETMLVGGENQESHKVGNWMMAPGFGLIHNALVDQHFAQRGRIGRLLGAVALNPAVLGIGIDENTAIVVENNELRVIGENAVYIVDGHRVRYTNISEASADQTMSMHHAVLHILSAGESFDLGTREPFPESTSRASKSTARRGRGR